MFVSTAGYNSGVLVQHLSFSNTKEGVEPLWRHASEAALAQLACLRTASHPVQARVLPSFAPHITIHNADYSSFSTATDAFKLARAVGDENERWLGAWSSAGIQRHLLGCIAVAVQRGNAMAMIAGYARATSDRARREAEAEAGSAI